MNDTKFIKPKDACKILGVNVDTIRRMAERNEIKHIRTDTQRYLYDVSSYLKRGNDFPNNKKTICYARVSSKTQKPDLQNQVALLKHKYPDAEIIFDYGSGLNFKRKGLQYILDEAIKGEIKELVVTYKDRLCRFGFDIIQYIIEKQSNAKIVVLCSDRKSPESELSQDLLSIITVFSTRIHGLRKYKSQIKEDQILHK
jgi:excisionase family DNA binding protein